MSESPASADAAQPHHRSDWEEIVGPLDDANRRLLSRVHPGDWQNPVPSRRYDLVVIGGGTAGLVSAAGAAGLGAKVALIELGLLGGDCLNVGCVPSKALLAAAHQTAARNPSAGSLNRSTEHAAVEFAQIMQRIRSLRADISQHDSVQRLTHLGVDVYLDQAAFLREDTIAVGSAELQFKRAILCTGARPAIPEIPGLKESKPLTNETVFALTELPRRMGIVGGGPIGVELAQAFQRLGAQVTLIEAGPRILPRDDADAAVVIAESLKQDGIHLLVNSRLEQVTTSSSVKILNVTTSAGTKQVEVDQVLVAVGRRPKVDGLNLEAGGIAYSEQGVTVDERLRTSNRRVFAAGDICSPYKFTHAADVLARTALRNALFFGRASTKRLLIPWCTYTSSELAQVGLTPAEATQQNIEIDTFTQPLADVDRARLEGNTDGFVRIHVKQGTDRILGATIVGPHAGDIISEVTLAMQHRIGLKQLADVIHPYPTHAEAIRKLGDQYNRTRLTPFTKRILKTIISLHR